MRFFAPVACCILWLLAPAPTFADPAGDVREAVNALVRQSHGWETTARQKFRGESTQPRLDPGAAVELRGRFDPDGLYQITLEPSRDLPVPVTAIFRRGDVVANTPLGWLRRSEMRRVPAPDRTVEFEGRQVRVSRVLSTGLKASAMRPLTEELFDLIADVKSWRAESGLVLGELREQTIEKLWGDPQAKRAPEIEGTVIFKIGRQGLSEYHTLLAIGFPNSRTKQVDWSMQQWSTRITGVGFTTVHAPTAALRALDKE